MLAHATFVFQFCESAFASRAGTHYLVRVPVVKAVSFDYRLSDTFSEHRATVVSSVFVGSAVRFRGVSVVGSTTTCLTPSRRRVYRHG